MTYTIIIIIKSKKSGKNISSLAQINNVSIKEIIFK
jgi:hypothetical protein